MTARTLSADIPAFIGRGLGAVGTMPGCTVTLVPYPESCRLWVRVAWDHGGTTDDTRTYARGELMLWLLERLAVAGFDYRRLAWEPAADLGPTDRNPFVTRRAS